MSDKHLVKESASVPAAQMCPRPSAFHGIFSLKVKNRSLEFCLRNIKGGINLRQTLQCNASVLIYYINTRPDDTFIHKV